MASLAITPQIASFTSIDETLDFTAIARDSAQNVLTGVSLTWTSSDEAVITIASTGQARAVGNGTATIRVASGGVSATASVTVTSGTGRTILFEEQFEDSNFGARGWYDIGGMILSTAEAHAGSSSLEFRFTQGANSPVGRGGRHLFTNSESIYLSYWVKYSASWVGSGDPYHPHEFQFVTNEDGQYVGPAFTNLSVLVEHNYQNGGIPVIAASDAANIDVSAVGQDLTGTTEDRAAHGCNGNTDGYPTDCYPVGGGTYFNGKLWRASQPSFLDTPGPGYKNDWHFVEALIQLNSIQSGIGQTDGVVQYWFDGQLVIDHQDVLLRTGSHPTMAFNQLLVSPFIGSGSPVGQTMWIDELTVATGR